MTLQSEKEKRAVNGDVTGLTERKTAYLLCE